MDGFKEFQGKNLDAAIQEACSYYNAAREKLEIEIVQDAKSGIFGIVGARKAKIRARRAALREAVESVLGKKRCDVRLERPSLGREDAPRRPAEKMPPAAREESVTAPAAPRTPASPVAAVVAVTRPVPPLRPKPRPRKPLPKMRLLKPAAVAARAAVPVPVLPCAVRAKAAVASVRRPRPCPRLWRTPKTCWTKWRRACPSPLWRSWIPSATASS